MPKDRPKHLLQACAEPGPEDGLDPRDFHRRSGRGRTNRKALQLCAQVEQTLALLLAGECSDARLRDLQVLAVTPAPNSTRLCVTVALPPEARPDDVNPALQRLAHAASRLRIEIAAAVHRKRAPELIFQVVTRDESRS